MEKADEDFQIIRLTKTYLNEARQLLEDCDLTPAGVGKGNGDFLLLVNAGSKKLQAIIGWEIFADSALLRSLAVREQYRQCGRAKILVERAIEQLRTDGRTQLYLLTQTAEDYLKKFGFVVIERQNIPDGLLLQSELKDICPQSSVCMYRQIK